MRNFFIYHQAAQSPQISQQSICKHIFPKMLPWNTSEGIMLINLYITLNIFKAVNLRGVIKSQ